jgi:hypothetical protein
MDIEQSPHQLKSQDHNAPLCSVKSTRQHSKLLCEEAARARREAQTLLHWSKRAWLSTPTFSAVYLSPADKYHRLTRRLSQGQKGLKERALMASQRPSEPW